ncbi:MAG: TIGR03761 family integrating conjugative element protein [Chromatiaceae bacterium]|nr:TIGR03761 family integrating conjugative element protein [Chromatiaceae bacterium]MCP5314514.1 TIGR03761 family integrating conjugative element protein [Chromatiaceae bacterium]
MTQNSGNPSAAQSPEEGVGRPDDRPGVLRGRATLTLQTRQAQRLVKGRGLSAEKPAIIGLLGFANRVRTLWHGARADDPYADWWLLQVDEALVQAGHELVTLEQAIAKLFEALGAIEVASPVSVKPARIALNFTNPYAFRAAALISQFDALACKVLTARHVGLVGRDEAERALHQGGRWARRALQSPVGYRLMGVTRDDVGQGNAKALQALEVMGEIPEDVRRGVLRAPHAPAVAGLRAGPMTYADRLRPLSDDL